MGSLQPLQGAVRPHHRNSSNGVRPAATKGPSQDWVDRLGLRRSASSLGAISRSHSEPT
jgi:hypothetical protein